MPEHKNIDPENISESIFKDRFRVQIAGQHSMTVTSHIAKDGHLRDPQEQFANMARR